MGSSKRPNSSGTQREDGRWVIMLTVGRDANGKPKRKYIYGKTQKEALEKWAKEKDKYEVLVPNAGDMTVTNWCMRWVNLNKQNIKNSTKNSYVTNIQTHISPTIGGIKVNKLTTNNVQYCLNLCHSGGSISLFKKVYSVLKGAMDEAVEQGVIKKNPVKGVVFPEDNKKTIRVLTEAERIRFIEALEGEWYRPLFLFYMYSGCRLSEALPLKWSDFDLEDGIVKIDKITSVIRDFDKKTSVQHVCEDRVKTKAGFRTILLTPGIIEVLNEHKEYLKDLVHKYGLQWSEDSLVFPNSYYKVPQMSNVEAVFRRIRDKAGIENFTLHGLRHTYATMALKETTNAKFVSDQLGHKSVKTTLDIYYNPNHEDKKNDVMKITGIDNFLLKAKENLEAEVEDTYDDTSNDESEEG